MCDMYYIVKGSFSNFIYTYTHAHILTGSSSSTTVTTSVPTSTKRKSLISTREPPLPAFKKPTSNEEWRKKRQGQREFVGRTTAAEGVCIYTLAVCLKLALSCVVD